jgi:hypothetical protein
VTEKAVLVEMEKAAGKVETATGKVEMVLVQVETAVVVATSLPASSVETLQACSSQ